MRKRLLLGICHALAWLAPVCGFASAVPLSPAAAGSVDLNAHGFIVYPFRQTSGGRISDVATQTELAVLGLLGPNQAVVTNWPNSENGDFQNAVQGSQGLYFVETNVVNWDLNPLPGDGAFNSGNGYTENEFPGIVSGDYIDEMGVPATDTANFQMLVEAWLYFPAAGTYTLGVNSDDGFSVKSGVAPWDVFGVPLGSFEGARTAAETLFGVSIPSAGYYPFRLLYEQGGGGASCEFYSLAGPAGSPFRQLINDYTNPITAFYSAESYPPCVSGVLPPLNSSGVSASPALAANLVDGRAGGQADPPTNIQLFLDGAAVNAAVSRTNGLTTVTFTPAPGSAFPVAGSSTASVAYSDGTGRRYTNTWMFTAPPEAPSLGSGSRQTSAGAGATNFGFMVYPFHTAGNQPNDVLVWNEQQVLGLEGTNYATLAAWPDSASGLVENALSGPQGFYFAYTNVINWDIGGPSSVEGLWQAPSYPKAEFPGLVTGNYPLENGFKTSDTSNFSELVEAWLYFPSPGSYTMGVNSDDGFSVKVGQAPGDVLGQVVAEFEGQRTASSTEWSFVVPSAGYYPFRLLYEQGGQGAACEWYCTTPQGVPALIGDRSIPGAIMPWLSASNQPPYVSGVIPAPNQGFLGAPSGPAGGQPVVVYLVDGAPNQLASVSITVNGAAQSAAISKSGGVTTAVARQSSAAPLWTVGANQIAVVYSDTAGNSFSNSWQVFVPGPLPVVLDVSQAYVLGSQDTNAPGFMVRTVQFNPRAGTQPDNIEWAEQMLAGLWDSGTNTANLADTTYGPATNGSWRVASFVNFAGDGGADGDFTAANGYPDQPFPGIPGLAADAAGSRTENFACEIQTWLAFGNAGLYTFVVNSDDGFRAYEATNHGRLDGLNVTGPAGVARMYAALPSTIDDGGFGPPLPFAPVSGQLVLANPVLGAGAGGGLLNAGAVSNNIVLFQSGPNSFQSMADQASAAGAAAMVVFNGPSSTGDPPEIMPGNYAAIPLVMIGYQDGLVLSNAAARGPVAANLGDDGVSLRLAEFEGTRGQADTEFSVYVPYPGVYPLRLVYEQGGGSCSLEFDQLTDNYKTRVLVNDTAHGGVAAFARLLSGPQPDPAPPVGVFTAVTVGSGGAVTISWTGAGRLQQASQLAAPGSAKWTIVSGVTGTTYTVPTAPAGGSLFFRLILP